jgi:D-tyrosyl-tRNA(Tyr) deacylase
VKAVIQRVKNASVQVEGRLSGGIAAGLLVYLGVARNDTEADADRLAEKIVNLRIFADPQGKMNLSLLDLTAAGSASGVLAVSQFTLLADARKGRRPFYGAAAEPEQARLLYEYFMEKIRSLGVPCKSGVFQTHMEVSSTNDGPVTIVLDTKR